MGCARNVVFSLIVVLTTMFVALNAHAAKGGKKDDSAVTDAVLQADLMSYADRYASIAAQALDDFERLEPQPDVRRMVMGDLVFSTAAAFTIAADADPQVALLDMVVMATLGRMIFEDYWLPKYGGYVEPVVTAMTELEDQAWQIADPILTTTQKTELLERIDAFHMANPELTTFSHLRFADFPSKRASSSLKATSSGGIFKSVQRITDQVEQTRMLAERGMYLSTRLPLLGGGFADIWLSRLSFNPAVEDVLGDVSTFAEVSERLAVAAEQLPQQITTERTETILQLANEFKAERKETVDHVFVNIANERQMIIDQLAAEEQRLTGVLAELRTTIEAGNELTLSVDALAERLDLGGEEGGQAGEPMEPAKPFDIEDYRQTLIQASAAIHDLNELVGSTHKLIDSDGAERLVPEVTAAIDDVGSIGQEMIDRIFYRAVVFLVLALVGVIASRLAYRWLEKRFFGTPAASNAVD
jgi:hypothetical protein